MGNLDISSFFLMLLQIAIGTLIFVVPAGLYCMKIKGFNLKMLKNIF